jgi:hypothetical protein
MDQVPLVAISYAHGPRDPEIIALSDRLRSEGIDCEIDAYDEAPAEGWGRRMTEMMTRRTVLVIASEAYYKRFHLEDSPGVGLGATFESTILVDRAVAQQGRNHDIIPVIMDASDKRYIPEFLSGQTHYDLSKPEMYDKLYRRLTGQQSVKPPIGSIRRIAPQTSAGVPSPVAPARRVNLALFHTEEGAFWVPISEVERAGNLKMMLTSVEDADLSRLRLLDKQRKQFSLAYGSSATFATISRYRELSRGDVQQVELEMVEKAVDTSFGTEMSYNGVSADEIAAMRARRILLDEKLPGGGEDMTARLNAASFESFVAGRINGGNRLVVNGSPIPPIAKAMAGESELIPAVRLFCVLLLILSGTVDHIERLDLQPVEGGIEVSFDGVRHKVYQNQPAPKIRVAGTCATA